MQTKFGFRSESKVQSREGEPLVISQLPLTARRCTSALLLGTSLVTFGSGCLERPIGTPVPVTTNIFVDKITQTSVDKIDLLFMVDNSGSMSDKQEILRLALPDLVQRLVDPICINSEGVQGDPADPMTGCALGYTREFNPIDDINIAVVSSSLGDVGANSTCPQGGMNELADMSHTIGSLTRGQMVDPNDEDYLNDKGFLEWRPGADLERFTDNFQSMVGAVGEAGCGWEASLESWYRFLVDPYPYKELTRVNCPEGDQNNSCVQPTANANNEIELDLELLEQRDEFLRPDSLVAIIMLTDENDCSMRAGGTNWVVARNNNGQMFRSTSACATNSNDPCCHICALPEDQLPEGCPLDPICNANPETGAAQNRLAASEDALNLRCYQQKRRFGLDFLYPTSRYVNALTQEQLCWSNPDLSTGGCPTENLVDNPLFPDGGRSQSLVFLAGIIGVPHQSIASTVDSNGQQLAEGILRFKTWEELDDGGDWDKILGTVGTPLNSADPNSGQPPVPPTDRYMLETEFERGDVEDANEVNGRDWNTTNTSSAPGSIAPRDDLQYACIFRLPTSRDCLEAGDGNCDCSLGKEDKPLCEDVPGESVGGNTQYWAKAYPGTRQLEVLKAYGTNSIVASICARNLDPNRINQSDYGYRPAVSAIIDSLKEQLADRCLPRPLGVDEEGKVPCTLVETTPQLNANAVCSCDAAQARQRPSPEVDSQIRAQLASEEGNLCGDDDPGCIDACLCEVLQVQQVASNGDGDEALRICQDDLTATGVQGWCYVSQPEGIGNAELVEGCADTEKRKLRFVGQGLNANTTTYVSCNGSSLAARQ